MLHKVEIFCFSILLKYNIYKAKIIVKKNIIKKYKKLTFVKTIYLYKSLLFINFLDLPALVLHA